MDAMAEQQMRNPFQNEQDAFYVLVVILIAAAIVIASAVLISKTLGAILAVIAIAIGLWRSAGWLRVAVSAPDEEDSPGPKEPSDETP
jgi:uncharacterized membrane protein